MLMLCQLNEVSIHGPISLELDVSYYVFPIVTEYFLL